jgi:hypothetical protein
MAHVMPEDESETRIDESTTTQARESIFEARRRETEADVARLAEALRAAHRTHARYLAELRQGDVEPAEDWATWYAEYLLGEQ